MGEIKMVELYNQYDFKNEIYLISSNNNEYSGTSGTNTDQYIQITNTPDVYEHIYCMTILFNIYGYLKNIDENSFNAEQLKKFKHIKREVESFIGNFVVPEFSIANYNLDVKKLFHYFSKIKNITRNKFGKSFKYYIILYAVIHLYENYKIIDIEPELDTRHRVVYINIYLGNCNMKRWKKANRLLSYTAKDLVETFGDFIFDILSFIITDCIEE